MNISVLFFGQLADITNINAVTLSDVSNTDIAIEKILEQYPELKNYTYVIAVEKKIIQENTDLKDHQTLALMPPFSGG